MVAREYGIDRDEFGDYLLIANLGIGNPKWNSTGWPRFEMGILATLM
jgi:hypothetical protein